MYGEVLMAVPHMFLYRELMVGQLELMGKCMRNFVVEGIKGYMVGLVQRCRHCRQTYFQ